MEIFKVNAGLCDSKTCDFYHLPFHVSERPSHARFNNTYSKIGMT